MVRKTNHLFWAALLGLGAVFLVLVCFGVSREGINGSSLVVGGGISNRVSDGDLTRRYGENKPERLEIEDENFQDPLVVVDTPSDFRAQLGGPELAVPAEMLEQLNSADTEIPDDMKKQLIAAPHEIPDDLKNQLSTPPKVIHP